MTPKSVGFKLGLIVAILHLLLVLLTYAAVVHSTSSTAGLAYLPFMFLDAPVLFLGGFLPGGDALMRQPLIVFGGAGSFLWFAIPWLADRLVARIFPNTRRWIRWLAASAVLPAAIFAFVPLSHLSVSRSIRAERPEEIQALLKNPSPGLFAKRTVLEAKELGGICGIHPDPAGGEDGVLVLFHRGVVRLDRDWTETSRVEFADIYYQTVEPVRTAGAFDERFLAYRFFDYAALLGPDGGEIWRAGEKTGQDSPLAGAATGDIDGDGRPEFALYHTYQKGISLHDDSGRLRWTHYANSIDHVVMADVRGNGRQEILMRAGRDFLILDADGTCAAQIPIETDSSGFALVHWPEQSARPNLLLTEDNRIRIVDFDGNDLRELDAPGCRSYGDVVAVPVRFRNGEPPALAVRKNVHPDLAVLYVYTADNRLIHQSVEIRPGGGTPALAAVPAGDSGVERLLVGSGENNQVRLLEYSLD